MRRSLRATKALEKLIEIGDQLQKLTLSGCPHVCLSLRDSVINRLDELCDSVKPAVDEETQRMREAEGLTLGTRKNTSTVRNMKRVVRLLTKAGPHGVSVPYLRKVMKMSSSERVRYLMHLITKDGVPGHSLRREGNTWGVRYYLVRDEEPLIEEEA